MKSKKVLLLVSLIALLFLTGCREIKTPVLSEPSDRNEAWNQDINYLKESFPKYNRSFTPESLQKFHEILLETQNHIPSMTDNEIHVDIMKAIATVEDVHTSVNMKPSALKLRRFPIRFYWFKEGLYVIKANPEYENLLGSRIEMINGRNPDDLVDMLSDVVPGNTTAVRYESSYLLNSPDFLNGLGVSDDPDSVSFTFVKKSGIRETRLLPAMKMGEKVYGYESWRELNPLSTESQDSGQMIHVLKGTNIPDYLASPDQSCYHNFYEDENTLYIQVNQNTNLNNRVSDFSKEIESFFKENNVNSVIVDFRFNTGGNLLLTGDLVKGIPRWFKGNGPINIIIGGPTFSAGIVSAARLKYYTGDRARIYGEPAAEGLQFWAETRFFRLPNSEILIFAAYAYHNWENKKYDREKKYFWLMRFVGVPAENLDVQYPVTVSFQDYLNGRDTIVDTILNAEN